MKANSAKETFFVNLVTTGSLVIRDDGTVLNTKTLKVYDRRGTNGQIQISVKVNGRVRHILASRLVYLVCKGPLTADDEVNHLDGVKWNNRPSNLERMDAKGTARHGYKSGRNDPKRISAGLKAFYDINLMHNSKLSHPQVIEIRNRFAAGESIYRLAREHKMPYKDMKKIIHGDAYRAVVPARIAETVHS